MIAVHPTQAAANRIHLFCCIIIVGESCSQDHVPEALTRSIFNLFVKEPKDFSFLFFSFVDVVCQSYALEER